MFVLPKIGKSGQKTTSINFQRESVLFFWLEVVNFYLCQNLGNGIILIVFSNS